MKVLLTPVEYKYIIQASDTIQENSEKSLNEYILASNGVISKTTVDDGNGNKYVSIEVSSDYYEEVTELLYKYSMIIVPALKGVISALKAFAKEDVQLATKWINRYKKANKKGQSEELSKDK